MIGDTKICTKHTHNHHQKDKEPAAKEKEKQRIGEKQRKEENPKEEEEEERKVLNLGKSLPDRGFGGAAPDKNLFLIEYNGYNKLMV